MPSVNLKRDNNHIIIPDSYDEKAFQGEYDGNNNLIYAGFAPVGSSTSVATWQIKKLTYTGTNLTSVTWPELNSKASTDYEFSWDDRATYTYS